MHIGDCGSARARVCYAPFPLLRLLTLHCTRKGGVAEGEGAQQTERGAADNPARPPRPPRGPRVTGRDLRGVTRTDHRPRTAVSGEKGLFCVFKPLSEYLSL